MFHFQLILFISGGLSVMLVVGDTWCAITDPLRYHSRVSGLKSWILIATTWLVSIIFCIASALRRDCRLITSEITTTLRKINWGSIADESESSLMIPPSSTSVSVRMTGDSFDFNDTYDLCYSCTFFVVIILAPICLVCAMYWKIFSEARQNSLRMRQNGSSPLLQSALNLVTVSAQLTKQAPHERSCSIIGEEDSNNADSLNSSNLNVIHITLRRNSMIADASPTHSIKVHEKNMQQNPTKLHASTYKINTLGRQRRYLEIPKINEFHSRQPFFRRDYTNDTDCVYKYRAHSVFETSALYCPSKVGTCNELRQVHSTPDLQETNSELVLLSNANQISLKLPVKKENHSTGSIENHGDTMASIATRRPSICEPPKALSYMNSIRHRLSNASSIFKYREESRAARISILVVIMFLFSYFPYGLLVMLQGRVTFYANSSCLAVLFLLIANISSPFIFAYRNRRVRRGVCRLFGVDAKTNERLQKQRIIMHSSLRTNSCRERKRKTKFVRINRNSAKSTDLIDDTHIQCKYSPVPLLFNKNFTEAEIKRDNHTISATNKDHNDYVFPSCQLTTDSQNSAATSQMHMDEKLDHYGNSNSTVKCHVDYNMLKKSSNKINESNQDQNESIHVKDFANDIFIGNQNRVTSLTNCSKIGGKNTTENDDLSKTSDSNINRSKSSSYNLSSTTGASVIKQKISFLRCVCMNTARKHSAPNSPTCISSKANRSFFDSQPVNV